MSKIQTDRKSTWYENPKIQPLEKKFFEFKIKVKNVKNIIFKARSKST